MEALKVASNLQTENRGENDEYDRALCEFIADFYGPDKRDVADVLNMTWHLPPPQKTIHAKGTIQTEAVTIEILFDGPPGPKAGRFIDIIDGATGYGIKWGDWTDLGDGRWSLVGPAIILLDEQDRSYERQGDK